MPTGDAGYRSLRAGCLAPLRCPRVRRDGRGSGRGTRAAGGAGARLGCLVLVGHRPRPGPPPAQVGVGADLRGLDPRGGHRLPAGRPGAAVTSAAISTTALRKRYGPRAALDGVDLEVPKGSVYGLVGPNGAGKTTLLAILAGLRRPRDGSVWLESDRRRVAMLPDTPSFDPWLTGREVVDLARALVTPAAPATRVDRALADAGLAEAAARRVAGYSRGMLQRLGLAATVVGDPKVLLLDEPCSALDPAGRREVLDLVARLSGQVTVLLSTHVLADVQQVCDAVGVLRAGRLLYQGPLDDLLVGRAAPTWTIRCRPPLEPVEAALARRPWVTRVERTGAEELVVAVASREAAEAGLAGALAEAGAHLVRLEQRAADLERVFLELTQ